MTTRTPPRRTPGKIDMTPRQPKKITPKIIMLAVEKFGKTTLGANASKPIILMARNETGYDTLLSSGRVPSIPALEIESWTKFIETLDALIENHEDRETLVLDAFGGFESLLHEYVCKTDFDGDWGEKGFMGFAKGYHQSVPVWEAMLSRLEKLNKQGMTIILLGHTRIKTIKNPAGPDYDGYIADVHEKTYAVTARWADAILFGKMHAVLDMDKRDAGKAQAGKRVGIKGKMMGEAVRVIVTENRDGIPAGNRYGMDSEIWLSGDHSKSWEEVWAQINRNQEANQ